MNNERVEELLLKDPSDLTDDEAAWLANEAQLHYSFEQSIKLILNSIYGAFANEYFHFYNLHVAETITLQGQDAIKYTEAMTNLYFKEHFHRDRPLLRELGVPDDQEVIQSDVPVVVYADTDSLYISFQVPMAAVGWTGSATDFVLTLNRVRLAGFFKKILDDYAAKRGVESYLDFELETIADSAIFVSKKKYVQDIRWKDKKVYEPLAMIKSTGLEIVRSSTPPFCRERLMEVMKYVFMAKKPTVESYTEIIRIIKKLKSEFQLSGVERISMTSSISDYHKFIADDQNELVVRPSCPIHVRASGYHNLLINRAPKYKTTYQLIRSKDKIKWYYAMDDTCDAYAFKSGAYPAELAPKIDVEKQFRVTVLDPLNRIMVPAGYDPLDPSLAYTIGLF